MVLYSENRYLNFRFICSMIGVLDLVLHSSTVTFSYRYFKLLWCFFYRRIPFLCWRRVCFSLTEIFKNPPMPESDWHSDILYPTSPQDTHSLVFSGLMSGLLQMAFGCPGSFSYNSWRDSRHNEMHRFSVSPWLTILLRN